MQLLSPKWTRAILYAEPIAMLSWFGFFYSYCFRVRSALGRWPVLFDSVPDPLENGYHDVVVDSLLILTFTTFVPWAVWLMYRLFWTKDLPKDWRVLTAVIVWMSYLAHFFINPAGLIGWYFD